uniref:Uncharacterized protein n=1 Tax=Bionectria ochroleuca TaxID=29856 RepID=A0A8H7KD76_BIOOC
MAFNAPEPVAELDGGPVGSPNPQSPYPPAHVSSWSSDPIPVASERQAIARRPVPPANLALAQQQYAHDPVSRHDSSSSRSSEHAGIPRLDYQLYSPPLFELSPDGITISTRTSSNLVENATALAAFLRAQASVPPKPQIHVKASRPTKTDFDIKLNLMSLLVPEDRRMRTNYIRCVGEGELAFRGSHQPGLMPAVGDGGLEEWCRLFVADPAEPKSFVLTRTVAHLDTMFIEGQLRSLISSTGYKGNLSITFPTTHARVVVRSADKVHKVVTSFKTMFKPKSKYDVAQAIWPFATAPMGTEGRQFTVQSEESWFREWRDPIKYAIVTKRHGWVTNEDKLEVLMEGKGKGVQPVDWDME